MAVEILAAHIPAADGVAALARVHAEHAALYAGIEPVTQPHPAILPSLPLRKRSPVCTPDRRLASSGLLLPTVEKGPDAGGRRRTCDAPDWPRARESSMAIPVPRSVVAGRRRICCGRGRPTVALTVRRR
jgi:hypothetical protein